MIFKKRFHWWLVITAVSGWVLVLAVLISLMIKPESGGDIDWVYSTILNKLTWTYPWTNESINPFFGMNSTWTVFNPWLFPGELVKLPWIKETFGIKHYDLFFLSSAIHWALLMVGIIVFSRIIKANWLVVNLILQVSTLAVYSYYFDLGFSFQNAWLCPMILQLYCIGYCLVWLFYNLGKLNLFRNILILVLIPLGCLFGLVSFLSHFSVIMITLIPFGAAVALAAIQKKEVIWKVAGLILTSLILIVIVNYITSSADYTSRRFFPNEIVDNIQDHLYAGILFRKSEWALLFFMGFMLGLFSGGKGVFRTLVLACIFHMLVMGLIGFLWLYSGINWAQYPSPHYLEQPVYPIYIIIATYSYYRFFKLQFLTSGKSLLIKIASMRSLIGSLAFSMLIPLLVWHEYGSLNALSGATGIRESYTPVHPTDDLTKFVVDKIALSPGDDFRGIIASIFEAEPEGQLLFRPYWATHWHRYAVPSLEEYSQTSTPQLFYFTSRLFWKKLARFGRNNIKIALPRVRLLAMLGTSLLITDKQIRSNPALTLLKKTKLDYRPYDLYLYKLKSPNLGNYSPTEYIVSTDANNTLNLLNNKAFSPQKTVILSSPVSKPLVATQGTNIRYEKGVKIFIDSNSPGWSLILLPVQFSNCLRFYGSSQDTVELKRANFIQTAVIFNKSVKGFITYDGGFFSSHCRREDIKDLRKMNLKQVEHPFDASEFHPYQLKGNYINRIQQFLKSIGFE